MPESNTNATPAQKGKFSYKQWYQDNKVRLSAKKKKLYAEDPVYRDAAIERSRTNRKKSAPLDLGDHTVAFKDAADQLVVSLWTLREWRRKHYFPEPFTAQGRMYFSPGQVALLTKLAEFFAANGNRTVEVNKDQLSDLVGLVLVNW
jgi:hypothetical protein